jgi:hypothetical protein
MARHDLCTVKDARLITQSRQSAHAELGGDTASAEMGYENAIWLLSALLDDAMYEGTGTRLRDEDRISVEKSELKLLSTDELSSLP